MDQEQIRKRLQLLHNMSMTSVVLHGEDYQTFNSIKTQTRYASHFTDVALVKPILKVRKTRIKESMVIIERTNTKDYLYNYLTDLHNFNVQNNNNDATLDITLALVYTDLVSEASKWLLDTGNYNNLTAEHDGIKELFTDNIYSGSTEMPNETARDFIELTLLQHKLTNELIVVSNYMLHKKFQNKNGLLGFGPRPHDCNFLILLGLAPAFIPELKDRLTADEKEFFKLLTTPVKLFHERASGTLYEQIILTPTYDNLVKAQKMERMRNAFRQQEERLFNNQIQNAQRTVEQLTHDLYVAEEKLLQFQKEMTFYQAGDSKLEDAVSYIFEHAYLVNVDLSGSSTLNCTFKVPLSQWDSEVAETIFKGLNKDPNRYDLDTAYLEEIKQFMQYVIIDQVAKYWMVAEFTIDLNTFDWRVNKAYWSGGNAFQPQVFQTYKAGPNPHMEYHSCTGSYSAQISRAVQKKDLPGTIESILAPYKNWNLTDGTVMGKMFRQAIPGLVRHAVPCIEYKGQLITIKELHQIITEEKNPKIEEAVIKKRVRKAKARVLNEDNDERTDAELEEELRTQAQVEGGEDLDD